jgi:hypothetical protein
MRQLIGVSHTFLATDVVKGSFHRKQAAEKPLSKTPLFEPPSESRHFCSLYLLPAFQRRNKWGDGPEKSDKPQSKMVRGHDYGDSGLKSAD